MKRVFITLLLVVTTLSVMSSVISRDSAAVLALRYFHSHGGSAKVAKLVDVADKSDLQNMYVFVPEDGSAGFVIFSASDQYTPVVGYSVENGVEMPLPNHVHSFLLKIDEKIAYAESFRAKPVQGWQELVAPSSSIKKKSKGIIAVAPMIETHWNQGSDYNKYCPVVDGVRAATGCAATAMAQVLRYWKYPKVGLPLDSYQYNDTTYSCGAVVFDWDNMPEKLTTESTTEEVDAVAKLMYYCGVGVKMEYTASGSAAYMPDVSNCFAKYLGYDDSRYDKIEKHQNNEGVWVSASIEEIEAARPVIYGGQGNFGGHGFVLDGIDADSNFHINWGWSGSYDGYFAYGNFVPFYSGGEPVDLNSGQEACFMVKPSDFSLHVSPASVELNRYGDSTIVNIITEQDASWTIDTAGCNCSWLTFSHLTGAGKDSLHEVKIYATANEEGVFDDCRRANFVVTHNGEDKHVELYQYNGVLSNPGSYGYIVDQSAAYKQPFCGQRKANAIVIRPEAFGNFNVGQMITSVTVGVNVPVSDTIPCSVVVFEDTKLPEDFDIYDTISGDRYVRYWGHEVYSEDFSVVTSAGNGRYTFNLAMPVELSKTTNKWVAVYFHDDVNVLYEHRLVADSLNVSDYPVLKPYINRMLCIGKYNYGGSETDIYCYIADTIVIDEERTLFNHYEREYDVTFNVINPCNEVDESLRLAVDACDTYMLPDRMVDKSKKYASLVSNVADVCDSVFLYDVAIHPSYRDTVAVSACGLLQTDDAIFSADGVYPFAEAISVFDCDSTVYLNLHILSDTFVAIDHTTSEPSYSWQGDEYTESGIYTKHFEGANGCDSIVSLYLTFASTSKIHGVSPDVHKAWAVGRTIYIANSVDKLVAVFNSNGVHLYDVRPDSNPMQLNVRDRGAYFVVFANGTVCKVMAY